MCVEVKVGDVYFGLNQCPNSSAYIGWISQDEKKRRELDCLDRRRKEAKHLTIKKNETHKMPLRRGVD